MLSVHRITMSPAFRISLQSNVTDNNCRLAVDFTYQKKLIQRLDFLAGAVCLLLLLPLIFCSFRSFVRLYSFSYDFLLEDNTFLDCKTICSGQS